MSTNGNGSGLGWKLAGILFGIVMGLLSWQSTRELGRADMRLEKLETFKEEAGGTVRVLNSLRPQDEQKLNQLLAEQSRQADELTRQSRLLSRIAAKLDVEE